MCKEKFHSREPTKHYIWKNGKWVYKMPIEEDKINRAVIEYYQGTTNKIFNNSRKYKRR